MFTGELCLVAEFRAIFLIGSSCPFVLLVAESDVDFKSVGQGIDKVQKCLSSTWHSSIACDWDFWMLLNAIKGQQMTWPEIKPGKGYCSPGTGHCRALGHLCQLTCPVLLGHL